MILFENEADRPKVSGYSLSIIRSLMTVAGVSDVTITSVQRTAAEQAHAMFVNCQKLGAESQFKLYGKYGDQVIQTYVDARGARRSDGEVVAEMADKITEIGPGNVSHHCADPAKLNVIDISASRIPMNKRADFHIAIRKEPRIARFFDPFTEPKDPAFHIEVPQTEPTTT